MNNKRCMSLARSYGLIIIWFLETNCFLKLIFLIMKKVSKCLFWSRNNQNSWGYSIPVRSPGRPVESWPPLILKILSTSLVVSRWGLVQFTIGALVTAILYNVPYPYRCYCLRRRRSLRVRILRWLWGEEEWRIMNVNVVIPCMKCLWGCPALEQIEAA